MSNEDMTDEEREHLQRLAAQAKSEIIEGAASQAEPEPLDDGGYDIPPAPNGHEHGEDGHTHEEPKTQAVTAFIVYFDASTGSALATGDLGVLDKINVQRPATLTDIRRGAAEVHDDANMILATQQTIDAQMRMAAQIQEQQAQQRIAAGLDLTGIKR